MDCRIVHGGPELSGPLPYVKLGPAIAAGRENAAGGAGVAGAGPGPPLRVGGDSDTFRGVWTIPVRAPILRRF